MVFAIQGHIVFFKYIYIFIIYIYIYTPAVLWRHFFLLLRFNNILYFQSLMLRFNRWCSGRALTGIAEFVGALRAEKSTLPVTWRHATCPTFKWRVRCVIASLKHVTACANITWRIMRDKMPRSRHAHLVQHIVSNAWQQSQTLVPTMLDK